MILNIYLVKLIMNKAYNRNNVVIEEKPIVKKSKTATVAPAPMKEKDCYDYLMELKPNIWTAKIVGDKKYLFYNNHFLNISELKTKIYDLYKENGYENYGYSKLDESDLVRYTSIRDILSKEFNNPTANSELDCGTVAQTIWENELKDFEWKPQPIILK